MQTATACAAAACSHPARTPHASSPILTATLGSYCADQETESWGQGWGWGVTHPHSRALLWQISASNSSCWWSHFHLPSDLPSLSPSLSSSPTQPSLPPQPSSLLYWNPDSLLLPTALFTLGTEHPRENIFPKKTNVEEPEMGVGESLSPIKKTQLSTAAEASEMQAR